jgi:ribosomal protein L35
MHMPKIKTHKATVKRFIITRTGKILKRKNGQDHFNSRESGVTTRSKRRDIGIAKTEHNIIRHLMPYN